MKISIIIATYRRTNQLKKCLNSIYPQLKGQSFEIIAVINGNDPDTLQELNVNYPDCKVISLEYPVYPAQARNMAIQQANGEYLCFLDDDVTLPMEYIACAQHFINQHPEIEIFGGPDQTPPDANYWEKALGMALRSPLATAQTRHRHTLYPVGITIEQVNEARLILCNLWLKRKTLEKENIKFDERFFRNEENVLLTQLKNRNFGYLPGLFLYHQRKANPSHLFKAISRSGFYRAKSFMIFPESCRPIFFVPTCFVIYLTLLILMPSLLLSIPLLLYLFLNLGMASIIALEKKSIRMIPGIVLYQLLINIFYGLGLFYSLIIPSHIKYTRWGQIKITT